MRRSERDWDLTIHNLDSHPIEHELGVTSQRAQLALVGELDMVVEVGHEVGRIAASAAPVTVVEGPPYLSAADNIVELIDRRLGGSWASPRPGPVQVVEEPA